MKRLVSGKLVAEAHLHMRTANDAIFLARRKAAEEKMKVARARALEDAIAKISDRLCDFNLEDGEIVERKSYHFMYIDFHQRASKPFQLPVRVDRAAELHSILGVDYKTADVKRSATGEVCGISVRMKFGDSDSD